MTATLARAENKGAPPAKKRRGLSFSGLALSMVQGAGYLVLCITVLEGFFYVARVGDSEYLAPDTVVGYKPMPGKEVTQRREGYGHYKFNSFGMQNDEVPLAKAPGVVRVAVLGDSYVESIQVERSLNYENLLAEGLSKRLGKKVEVLNFGVANYSVAQDYLRYLTLARKFKPDLVILGFRVEEVSKLLPEPTKKLVDTRPVFFRGPDGNPVYDNTCVRNFLASSEGKRITSTDWLRRHSNIWGVIGGMMRTVYGGLPPFGHGATQAPVKRPVTPDDPDVQAVRDRYTRSYWYLMDMLLTNLDKACREDHARLMILRTPSGNVNRAETELVLASAARLGAPVLELDQKYKQEFKPSDDLNNFFCNGHFTRNLHRWIEANLETFIVDAHPDLLGPKAQEQGGPGK